jgi:hypothetical protein
MWRGLKIYGFGSIILVPIFFTLWLGSWILTETSKQPLYTNGHTIINDTKVDVDVKLENIKKQLVVKRSPPRNALDIMCWSLPTDRKLLSSANFLINVLLLAAAVDSVVRPMMQEYNDLTFARVGAIDETSVNIVVRYPNVTDGSVRVMWRNAAKAGEIKDDESGWNEGPVVALAPERDFVGVGQIKSLWPLTEYQCMSFIFVPVSFKAQFRS